MRTAFNLLVLGLVIAVVWRFYPHGRHGENAPTVTPPATSLPSRQRPAGLADPSPSRFRCDGRQYCSQMTSCAEATYFLEHCPGVKMDGDHDGIPCESQWCPNG